MAFRLRDLFSLVHSGPELIDPGEWDFRDCQLGPAGTVDEVDIPQLKAGNRRRANVGQILFEIVGAAGHVEEREAVQFLPGRGGVAGQRHFVDARTIRQLGQIQILLDAGQYEIAGPVDRAVAA